MAFTIGVLAFQGGFQKHIDMLSSLKQTAVAVRTAELASDVDALVIPGGESTTIGMLMERFGVLEVLKRRISREQLPVFGTCAGAILLADEIIGSDQPRIGGLDVSILRNAYGRQIDSFRTVLPPGDFGDGGLPAVFIRAPIIERLGESVNELLSHEGDAVLVRDNHILAATFHPELTEDLRLHEYFLKEVAGF